MKLRAPLIQYTGHHAYAYIHIGYIDINTRTKINTRLCYVFVMTARFIGFSIEPSLTFHTWQSRKSYGPSCHNE